MSSLIVARFFQKKTINFTTSGQETQILHPTLSGSPALTPANPWCRSGLQVSSLILFPLCVCVCVCVCVCACVCVYVKKVGRKIQFDCCLFVPSRLLFCSLFKNIFRRLPSEPRRLLLNLPVAAKHDHQSAVHLALSCSR